MLVIKFYKILAYKNHMGVVLLRTSCTKSEFLGTCKTSFFYSRKFTNDTKLGYTQGILVQWQYMIKVGRMEKKIKKK